MKDQPKPILVERYADNGEHSHYELIDDQGRVLWSEEVKQSVDWKGIADALARGLFEPIDYIGTGENITETIEAVEALKLYNEAIKSEEI